MRAVRRNTVPTLAERNPRIAAASMLANSYQPAELNRLQSAVVGAAGIADAAKGRIAQVYATPRGKLAIGAAVAAPFAVPMVLGAFKQPENPDQKPYSTGMTGSEGTGLNGGIVPMTGVELPDEASVKRKLQQLEDNQYYNQLQLQALQYVAANRGQFEQPQQSR